MLHLVHSDYWILHSVLLQLLDLSKEDKVSNKDIVEEIYVNHDVSQEHKKDILKMRKFLIEKAHNATEAGKARKESITKKTIIQQDNIRPVCSWDFTYLFWLS